MRVHKTGALTVSRVQTVHSRSVKWVKLLDKAIKRGYDFLEDIVQGHGD
jgi:hypothetical protein